MGVTARNILVTGLPGSGKTTFARKLAHELGELGPSGFLTGEVREQGSRKGFGLSSLDGTGTGLLAHVDIPGPLRVGRYGVDLPGFERFLAGLDLPGASSRLVILDEIGRMECLSARFRDLVVALLDGPVPVVVTIALKAGGFIEEVKRRGDVRVFVLTDRNRERLLADVAALVRALPNPGGRGRC